MTTADTLPKTNLSAVDVLKLLSEHYNPSGRPRGFIFAPEIQAPNSARRADLICAPLTHSGGDGLIGHEVKVSRADVLAELADPTKHDEWAQYCKTWWLVVSDPALIDGLDIPDHWGVMAPPSGRRTRSMTIIRKAPDLTPVVASDAWVKLARWQSHRVEGEIAGLKRTHENDAYLIKSLEARLRKAESMEAATGDWRMGKALEIYEAVTKKSANERLLWNVSADEVADAVIDAAATRSAAAKQRQYIERIEAALDSRLFRDSINKARKLGLPSGGV